MHSLVRPDPDTLASAGVRVDSVGMEAAMGHSVQLVRKDSDGSPGCSLDSQVLRLEFTAGSTCFNTIYCSPRPFRCLDSPDLTSDCRPAQSGKASSLSPTSA